MDVLFVVIIMWALLWFVLECCLGFLHCFGEVAAGWVVVWVLVEGVGVVLVVLIFGDCFVFGHSIIGVVVLEWSVLRVEVVGCCWSCGCLLFWFV